MAQGQQLDTEAREALRSLTKVQRMYVKDGCIHGDCSMRTARLLMGKGMFHLVISSPNGKAGFLHLTPLGERVRSLLTEAGKVALEPMEPR